VLAETGRWPWIVYELLKVEAGVTPADTVSAGTVSFTLIAFTLLYTAVTIVTAYLIFKFGKSEPDASLAEATY
jgi:cytochrome d ubiquinol oxidase subunit I